MTRRRLALAVLVPVLLTLSPTGVGAVVAGPPTTDAAPGVRVTLVTGDRVTVLPGPAGRPLVSIEAARWPGRRVDFRTSYADGGVRVVPSDAAALVPGVLDPALFDVSGLIRAGYDDGSRATLPLILRGVPTALAGRSLASIGAAAVALPKTAAADFGRQLTGVSTLDTTRVWLDGVVRADALDRNLRQIDAPAAWDAGLSGAGVRVAVLDTGVDSGHPDLVGRVVAAENFTNSPVATDRFGHGTHVASLVAGSGAAANGARRGVAFGASLLSGKVLGDDGTGQFSAIIAGMEWAVANGARVVNMSLGSDGPSTGRDPLSLALNELSASSGTLFVTSAGNTGPRESTIGAPGAADAALTVGAVDGQDVVAAFSSRGPRLGDHAVKPDLVAPGVQIVAARAAGTALGTPVNARYTQLSGTSMAAPHVAGAAALLAQRNPLWTAAILKGTLMGTSAATPGGVFERGAGRLDLGAALRPTVTAEPTSLSYGLISYPQAGLPPVTRTVTFTGLAAGPSTVDLTATMRDPAGRPAPAGMVAVSPARVTIPAGGTATASVSVAVALGGFGVYSGDVVASVAGQTVLRVPIGVVKESTRHVVRVQGLDRNGLGAGVTTLVTLINLRDTAASPEPVAMIDGEATVRVVPGSYLVTSALPTLEEGGEPPPDSLRPADLVITSISIATIADQTIDHDQTLVLDARAAEPLSATVRGVDTFPVDVRVFVAVRDPDGNGFTLGYDTSADDVLAGRLLIQPTQRANHGRVELSSKWRLSTGGGPTYDLLFAGNRFPDVLQYAVNPHEARLLGTRETLYRTPGTPVTYREFRQVFTDLNPVSVAFPQEVPGLAPLTRTEYVSSGDDRLWFQCATVVSLFEGGIGDFCQVPSRVRPGSREASGWLAAPLRTVASAFRTGTALFVGMNDLAEAGPHSGSLSDQVIAAKSYELWRNGELVSSGTDVFGGHPVPPGKATFRLVRRVELRPEAVPLSTVVESAWTFTSAPPTGRQTSTEPAVLDVALGVPVDETNHVAPGVPLTIELAVSHQTAIAPRVTTVNLWMSTDDGAQWTELTLARAGTDRYRATLVVPPGAAVSLRTAAADRDGNRFEQTILRAFLTAPGLQPA